MRSPCGVAQTTLCCCQPSTSRADTKLDPAAGSGPSHSLAACASSTDEIAAAAHRHSRLCLCACGCMAAHTHRHSHLQDSTLCVRARTACSAHQVQGHSSTHVRVRRNRGHTGEQPHNWGPKLCTTPWAHVHCAPRMGHRSNHQHTPAEPAAAACTLTALLLCEQPLSQQTTKPTHMKERKWGPMVTRDIHFVSAKKAG